MKTTGTDAKDQGNQVDFEDLEQVGDELSDDLLEIAVGAMRTVMPTYCWHKDGPHLTDWVSH